MTALIAINRAGEIVIAADSKATWTPTDPLQLIRKIHEIEGKYFAFAGLAWYRPTQYDFVTVARSVIRQGLSVQETVPLLIGAFQPELEKALTYMLANEADQYRKFTRHAVVLAGLESGLLVLTSVEFKLAEDCSPVELRCEILLHEDRSGYLWSPKESSFTFDKDKETLLEATVRFIESEIEKDSTQVDWPIRALRLTADGREWHEFQKH
jgi:hypothetical protein